MRSDHRLSPLTLLASLVVLATGCGGSLANQAGESQPTPSLQALDTSKIGGKLVVSGSSATSQSVGMSFRPPTLELSNALPELAPRIVSTDGIALIRSDTIVPTIEVIPNGLAATTTGGTMRLVGMGGPTPGYWVTAESLNGAQVLGLLDANGKVVASVAVTSAGVEPILPTTSSAIAMGRVSYTGSFITPRVVTTEAGSVALGMHSFDSSMREGTIGIAGQNLRNGEDGSQLHAVNDFDFDAKNQAVCAYGQAGLVVVSLGGSSRMVPYLQTPTAIVTHVVAGRTASEALALAGTQVLVINTLLGETRPISIGTTPFATGGSYARRLFREGGIGVVVGDARIIRFDIQTGTLLPEVLFGFGPVLAAEQSNGKLFLAHAGGTSDLLTWLPLR